MHLLKLILKATGDKGVPQVSPNTQTRPLRNT
jgi:hypothetical protein